MERVKLLEDLFNHIFLPGEERIRPVGVQVAGGCVVKGGCLHHAPCRELVDHPLGEVDLRVSEAAVAQKR